MIKPGSRFGWEVQKLRNEMFTSDFGFIVDFLAEVLKELRKEDHTQAYTQYFQLSDSITTCDKKAIANTFSELVKVIFPDGNFSREEAKELVEFAIECRRRVNDQLRLMDDTFEAVDFSYTDKESGKKKEVFLPYRLRNFMEFATLVAKTKEDDQEVKLHLVTKNTWKMPRRRSVRLPNP